jgi:hypothetical protein
LTYGHRHAQRTAAEQGDRADGALRRSPWPALGVLTQMDYQLVIKFWRKSLEDETFLLTIQDELKRLLGDAVKLDGYDVSDDEINLFVLTPDPKHSFRRIKTVLENRGIVRGISAASRLVGGAHFTSIWPIRATRKFKLPSK